MRKGLQPFIRLLLNKLKVSTSSWCPFSLQISWEVLVSANGEIGQEAVVVLRDLLEVCFFLHVHNLALTV